MDNAFLIYKPTQILLPRVDSLYKIYSQYDYSINFVYLNNNKKYLNLDYSSFDIFQDDLYNQVDCMNQLVIFFTKSKGNYINNQENKYFYKTTDDILISQHSINFFDQILNFDDQLNSEIFKMFIDKNACIKINENINLFGNFYYNNGIFYSKKDH